MTEIYRSQYKGSQIDSAVGTTLGNKSKGSLNTPVYLDENGVANSITSYSGTSDKAVKDGEGNNIAETYATKAAAQERLVSGINIKTVNGESVLGTGDVTIDLSSRVAKAGDTMTGTLKTTKVGTNGVNAAITASIPRDSYCDFISGTDAGNSDKRAGTIRINNSATSHKLLLGVHDFNDGVPDGITITHDGTIRSIAVSGNETVSGSLEVSGASNLNGATFSGNVNATNTLLASGASVPLKARVSNIDTTVTPSATQNGGILVQDKNGTRVGMVEISATNDGTLSNSLNVMRTVNGSNKYAYIRANIKSDGTPYSLLSGDTTITGTLRTTDNITITRGSNPSFIGANSSFDYTTTTAPSSNTVLNSYYMRDKNGKYTGYIENTFLTNNIVKTALGARRNINGTEKTAAFWVAVDSSGKAVYSHSQIITTYSSGTSGYRIWSDGYCEQWGQLSWSGAWTTVTLVKTFANANYQVFCGGYRSDASPYQAMFNTKGWTTTTFSIWSSDDSSNNTAVCRWRACGYLATGQY